MVSSKEQAAQNYESTEGITMGNSSRVRCARVGEVEEHAWSFCASNHRLRLARDTDIMLAEGMSGFQELILRRRPRALPIGRWESTWRRMGSSLFLSTWWTRTCLEIISRGARNHPSSQLHTVEDCRVADICVAGPGRTDKHTRASYAPGHVASSRSCA